LFHGEDVTPYETFCQDVERCLACPLARTRQQVVISRGNPEADLVFIGEAPGKKEDAIGEPLVGAPGKLLDDMLEALKLDPDKDICIFNILKCRPPSSEFPKPGAVKKCLPLLDRQLELVSPKVVILVGKMAAQYLVWRAYPAAPKMEDLSGRWIWSQRYPHIQFFAMYHPAYLLGLEDDDPDAFEDEYDNCLDTIEWGVHLLEGKEPPLEPLVVGSRVMIEKARTRRERAG
jgi:DNA polymerase